MSIKPRLQLSIRYLIALYLASTFCAAAVGYAAGSKMTPKLVLEQCGSKK